MQPKWVQGQVLVCVSLVFFIVGLRAPTEPDRASLEASRGVIAFSVWSGLPTARLYIMNADGTNPDPVEQVEMDPLSTLAWSPDGTQVAFALRHSIHIYNLMSGQDRQLTPDATSDSIGDSNPTWSPDGKFIAYVASVTPGRQRLYVIRADGRYRRALTAEEFDIRVASWSPDGKRLAFDLQHELDQENSIRLVNVNGSSEHRIGPQGASNPAWSPDGTQLAFQWTQAVGNNESWKLFVMDVNGKVLRQLTTDTASAAETPSWSPDGNQIVYSKVLLAGLPAIGIVDADGSGERTLLADSANEYHFPAWSPVTVRLGDLTTPAAR